MLHFSVKGQSGSDGQLRRKTLAVEPNGANPAGLVGQEHRDRTSTICGGMKRNDFRDQRGGRVGTQVPHAHERSAILVASREEQEQIPHSKNAQAGKGLGTLFSYTAKEPNRRGQIRHFKIKHKVDGPVSGEPEIPSGFPNGRAGLDPTSFPPASVKDQLSSLSRDQRESEREGVPSSLEGVPSDFSAISSSNSC